MSSWFELVEGIPLFQGDILMLCPVPLLPAHYPPDTSAISTDSPLIVEGNLEIHNVIVLSQSCDLINNKLKSVLVSPFFPLSRLPDLVDDPKLKEEANRLRSLCNFIKDGYSPRFHMLSSCELEGHKQEFCVVDFRGTYSIPFSFAEAFAEYSGARLRLVSPYTEHLSQAFARSVMRVGLPSPIPDFKK